MIEVSQAVRVEAARQLTLETFAALVEVEKQRLRTHRPWWHKVFPFIITIRRR